MYTHDKLNTTTVVVLQVLFHYEIIYEMSPLMIENQVKSPSPVSRSLSSPRRGMGRDTYLGFYMFFHNLVVALVCV